MKINEFKPKEYKTAAARALNVMVIKQFGSLPKFAKELGTTRQNINMWLTRGGISTRHVGKVCRILKCDPFIFAYEEALLLFSGTKTKIVVRGYEDVISDNFTRLEAQYILGGEYVKSASRFIIKSDKELKC